MMSMVSKAFDDYPIKNQHCTPEEIDDRQALEVAALLDQWESGAMPPWDVLLHVYCIVGAPSYGSALWDYSWYRDCATAEGARAFVLQEYREHHGVYATHVKGTDAQSIADATWSARQKYNDALEKLKKELRPQVLDENCRDQIQQATRDIRAKLEDTTFDSWSAIIAVAEVLYPAAPPELRQAYESNSFDDRRYDFFLSFKREVEKTKERFSGHKKDIEATLGSFTAETEERIKKPLALRFARKQAYTNWVSMFVEKSENLDDLIKWLVDGKNILPEDPWQIEKIKEKLAKGDEPAKIAASFYEYMAHPERPTSEDDAQLVISIPYPDRLLCDKIEIAPSGSGLIQIRDKLEAHSWEPTSVARITTYSVSFIPKNPDDIDLLKSIVEQALRILGDIPYKYRLAGSTGSGESYRRVKKDDEDGWGRNWEQMASAHVDTKDGKVSPFARFDLDDLWLLYILLEPIIEANAQIAAAMNAARYAEERGAILQPTDRGAWSEDPEHAVADDDHTDLKRSQPGELLGNAMRNTFKALAIGEIDEAEFIARISSLAHHTLTGSIIDPAGDFPSFNSLIADEREAKKNITTYDIALQQRTQDLVRCLIGEPDDSKRPLYVALMAAVNEISQPLKEQSRETARGKRAAFKQRMAEERRRHSTSSHDLFARFKAMFDQDDYAVKRSDAVAGHAGKTDEELNERRKGALTVESHLVIANSAVETAIDGIHYADLNPAYADYTGFQGLEDDYGYYSFPGTYMTRTAGSLHVRWELPEKLKPFCPHDAHRPSSGLRTLKIAAGKPSVP